MSINITVHGNQLESVNRKTALRDPEFVRKEQLAERRKQRLEQVRQQSKEVAQHVRENVGAELKKQERRIEEQKQRELLEWREKALAEAEEQRKKSLNAFGAAHRAALAERENAAKVQKEKRKKDALAQQRGKEALLREKQSKTTKKPVEKPKVQLPRVRVRKNDENSSKAANANRMQKQTVESEGESTDSSLSEEELPETKSTLKENKVVVMDINTDTDDSSSVSLEDSHEDSNRHFYRTSEKSQSTVLSKPAYNCSDYRQSDTSSEKSNSIEDPKPRQFTKISDLIQKRLSKTSMTTLDIPPNSEPSITPTKSCLKSKPPPPEMAPSSKIQSQVPSTSKKTSISTKPRSEVSNTVQFYDYDNKFSKAYEPREGTVKPVAKPQGQINAMESARLELQLQKQQQKEAEETRRKADERCQNAIEREKVRRDCEQLTQKLDSLNREIGVLREIDGRGAINVFTQSKMEKENVSRQKKMTSAFEDILNRSVVITCPEIERKRPNHGKDTENVAPSSINVARITEPKDFRRDFDNVSTSDSCASILLDYVNKQSAQISQDIRSCENSNTLEELKGLLKKINDIRDQIIAEIEKQKARNDKKSLDELKGIAQSVNDLRRERESILSEEKRNIEFMKAHLDKREKLIREKEKDLERKLRKIAENQMMKEKAEKDLDDDIKDKGTKEDNELKEKRKEPKKSTAEQTGKAQPTVPIEIVIKLRNETSAQPGKSPYKSPRKRSSLIPDFKHTKRKKVTLVKHKSSDSVVGEKSLPKTPAKKTVEISPTKSRSSTSYLSLPEAIHTKLGELLSIPVQQDTRANSAERDRTEAVGRDHTEGVKQAKPFEPRQQATTDQTNKKVNPALMHYIQRLLGMSRSSIDMLGVSSSEVGTPSSSIVAVPSNQAESGSDMAEKERIRRLQAFINENYSFISEMEESFKSSKSTGSSASSSSKEMEKIWRTALQQQQEDLTPSHLEKQIKSILKKKATRSKSSSIKIKTETVERSVSKKSVETQVEEIPKSEKSVEVDIPAEQLMPPPKSPVTSHVSGTLDTNQLVDQYTQLTNNCTKRIAELTDMINKVRKEKQKILEITLTSGSETGRNSTEYLDLPEGRINKSDEDSGKVSGLKKVLEAQADSERMNLERNKLTGVSRDSGISLSRPVTALDSHEVVPDARILGRISPTQHIQPILKDSSKYVVQEAVSIQSERPDGPSFDAKKPHKPPATIARYSPQLIEELPHELSTILEVETPITSRINTLAPEENAPAMHERSTSAKSIHNFPTYEEYVRKHNIDVSQFIDIDRSSKMPSDFQDFINASNKGNLQYQEFPSFNTYLRDQGHTSGIQHKHTISAYQSIVEADVPSFKRFPSHKSYVEKHNVSGLLDSQSIAAVSVSDRSTPSNPIEDSESTESLPDVVAELKKRHIIEHSFRNEIAAPQSDGSSGKPSTSSDERAVEITVVSSSSRTPQHRSPSKTASNIKSPVKKKMQIVSYKSLDKPSRTEQSKIVDLTGIELLPPSSTSTSSSQSTSQSLEKELDKMGLKWASLMLKKSQQSMELGSTSSSFTYEQPRRKSPKKTPEKMKISGAALGDVSARIDEQRRKDQLPQSPSDSNGKPFNLKEFFTKELQKRATTSISLSSTDDSIASNFIKSLLGSASSTPVPSSERKTNIQDRQRPHTSTPVHQKKSSTSSKSSPDSTKLFSGESALSSVRFSSGSNHPKQQPSLQDCDALSASHLKLKCRSEEHKSSNKSS
ncbi:unnamed protein product [Hermetia illucens]|uniref:Uncharacterized protein n=1 Tax=Hermetia illucens TaxID=343691 RepID=A0A7R8Z3Y1_HERIL|nr:myb-like protein X [Hermetia illucens]CAD7092447.1 unnamed protein product [Hermetia illucens]